MLAVVENVLAKPHRESLKPAGAGREATLRGLHVEVVTDHEHILRAPTRAGCGRQNSSASRHDPDRRGIEVGPTSAYDAVYFGPWHAPLYEGWHFRLADAASDESATTPTPAPTIASTASAAPRRTFSKRFLQSVVLCVRCCGQSTVIAYSPSACPVVASPDRTRSGQLLSGLLRLLGCVDPAAPARPQGRSETRNGGGDPCARQRAARLTSARLVLLLPGQRVLQVPHGVSRRCYSPGQTEALDGGAKFSRPSPVKSIPSGRSPSRSL